MNERNAHLVMPLILFGVLGCGSGLRPVNPPSFIRPERVAFSCVRTDKAGEPVPVPLDQCSPCNGHTGEHSLYAFVTQSARGELAAVDLKARKVIDTQTTVPGFTFVAVGEAPTAIVVPTIDPTHTFVVNLGSSDLHVLDTRRLLSTRGVTTARLAVIPLGRMTGGSTWEQAEPLDMALSADEQHLLIAAPRLHGLIVVAIADVTRVLADEITAAELPQTIVPLSGLSSPATLVTATGSDRYSESCGIDPPQPSQAMPERIVEATTAEAMPVALTLDAEHNRVLVADAALPIIHAVDLATLTEVTIGGRPLFVTGVPTLDVVVSPPVPVSHGDSVYEQYLYAIDADTRGVLVMNDRGVMQSVNAVGTPDRIDFGGRAALSLEIIEPGYRDCIANTSSMGQRMLRGVFLAASTIDGSVKLADIYDLHAEARCTAVPTTGESVACSESAPCAAIHRHRARIATAFTSPQPCVQPLLSSGTGTALTVTVKADATAEQDQATPNLVKLEGCDAPTIAALRFVSAADMDSSPSAACPADDDADQLPLVCVNADPWAGAVETWSARWEGQTTDVGSGELRPGNGTFFTDTMDYCRAGVVGGADKRFELELLVRVAPQELRKLWLPGREEFDCSIFTAKLADGTYPRLTFPINDATVDTLTLGPAEGVPEGVVAADYLEDARYCAAGMRFDFVVRSRNRYTVTGERSGYVHRVVRDANGTCVVDEALDPLREGQAIAGRRFQNATIAFKIGVLYKEPIQDLRFVFPLASGVSFVEVDTDAGDQRGISRTIVSEIRYSPIDAQLYAVDSHIRGLLPIGLSPLPLGSPTVSAFR